MQARNEEENADGQPYVITNVFALRMFSYIFSPPYLVNTLNIGMCVLLNACLVLYIHCCKKLITFGQCDFLLLRLTLNCLPA